MEQFKNFHDFQFHNEHILYNNLGVPAQNLITAPMTSIPASIPVSKLRVHEMDELVTRGWVAVDLGEKDAKNTPVNVLHAFSEGAVFGLVMVSQILCNMLTILSLGAATNDVLTWIGHGFGIYQPPLQLLLCYVFLSYSFLPLFAACPPSTYIRPHV
jgi:CNT family concentrative nucleoside transporter